MPIHTMARKKNINKLLTLFNFYANNANISKKPFNFILRLNHFFLAINPTMIQASQLFKNLANFFLKPCE